MANDTTQDAVIKELKLYGIKPTIEKTAHHVAVSWQVSPDKPVRVVTVTTNDTAFRNRLNARADTRRYLKADNAQIPLVSKKINERIFELPKPVELEPVPNQLAALRDDLADIASLLLAAVESIELINVNAANPRFVVEVRQITGTEPAPEEKNVEAPAKKVPVSRKAPRKTNETGRRRNVADSILSVLTQFSQLSIKDIQAAENLAYSSVYNSLKRLKRDKKVTVSADWKWSKT